MRAGRGVSGNMPASAKSQIWRKMLARGAQRRATPRLGCPAASTLEAHKEALSDKEWSVRAGAVYALSLRNDPALRKFLEPLLLDDKSQMRLAGSGPAI